MPQSDIARNNAPSKQSAEWWRVPLADTLTKILDLVEDAIISVDCEQRIIVFNHAAERVFGYAAREICGKTADALLPSGFFRHRGAHVVEFPRSLQLSRPMPVRHEIVARRKNGEEFPAEASISEFPTEDGWMLTVILRGRKSNARVVPRGSQAGASDETVGNQLSQESQNGLYSMNLLRDPLFQCQASSTERSPVADAPILLEGSPDSPPAPGFVANSESVRQLRTLANRVAASEASTILIEGESGVGKDVSPASFMRVAGAV